MALLNTKAGSVAAMRQALTSLAQYIEGQEKLDAEYHAKLGSDAGVRRWWPLLPDTILEVKHANTIHEEIPS